jgi:hypothetical protein
VPSSGMVARHDGWAFLNDFRLWRGFYAARNVYTGGPETRISTG